MIFKRLLIASLFACCALWAESPKETLLFADSCYKRRADGAQGDKANSRRLDLIEKSYRSILEDPSVGENAALGLLRTGYFRIRFAAGGKDNRKKLIQEIKVLGDTLHERFPKNKEITSLYATIFSMWGNSIGPLNAVRKGAAARVRDLADSAGNYQILGRAHYLLPYIPLILPWPDKDLARKYLERALVEQSDDPYTYFFLGELYFDEKRFNEALGIIERGLALGIRKNFVLEDKRGRWNLNELKKKILATYKKENDSESKSEKTPEKK